MMQALELRSIANTPPAPAEDDARLPPRDAPLSPEGMALFLRRTGGDAAPCFARAICENAEWANEAWGAYWAAVVRLV